MRARNIKPGFWKNEDLVDLAFEHRLLFIGLWMLADREGGRLEDRPKRIKMELFPCDNVNVEAGLQELCALGLLERYECQGVKVILITKFAEHQSPHHSEKRSELPGKAGYNTVSNPKKVAGEPVKGKGATGKPTAAPTEDHRGQDKELPNDNGEPTVDLPETYGESTVDPQSNNGRNRPDSLNPDSLNPEPINTHGTSASDAPNRMSHWRVTTLRKSRHILRSSNLPGGGNIQNAREAIRSARPSRLGRLEPRMAMILP